MTVLLDSNNLDLVYFNEDEERPAILCENFTWLMNQLKNWDPGHGLAGKRGLKFPTKGRGTRRIERSKSSENLGYTYSAESEYDKFKNDPNVKITNAGTSVNTEFGYPVKLERWHVTAPWPVKDRSKGETYYGGPYECLITAREDLDKKKKTRCYVSCTCEDFKYSFKADLQEAGYYTKSEVIPKPSETNPAPHAPAICKHLYTILEKFYGDYIKDEGGNEDPNAELFASSIEPEQQKGIEPEKPISISPAEPEKKVLGTPETKEKEKKKAKKGQEKKKPEASKKQLQDEAKKKAESAIIDAIMAADRMLNSKDPEVYRDTRKFSHGKTQHLKYYKYKFSVRVDSADGKASIYYANPIAAGSSSGQKILTIPKFGKADSFYKFTPEELRQLITQYSTEIQPAMIKNLEKRRKDGSKIIIIESVIEYTDEMRILNETSDIKRQLLCFNYSIM